MTTKKKPRKKSVKKMPRKKLIPKKPQPKPQPKPSPVKPKHLWDLDRDGITQSGLKRFLDCPHQFWLSYVKGWSPKGTSDPLEFGSAFHDLEAQICMLLKKKPDLDLAKKLPDLTLEYLERRDSQLHMDGVAWNAMDNLMGLVETTILGYFHQWEKINYNWVERETTFRVPSPNGITLRGRWDGIFENTKGDLYLFETKTKGRIDEHFIQASLPFDIQAMLYCYTAQVHFKRPIKGVVYNVIRKTGLKIKVNENIQDYLDRVSEDIQKRPGWYYMRWQVTLPPLAIDQWNARVLNPLLVRFREWWESVKMLDDPFQSPLHCLNPDALQTRWGTRSQFFEFITGETSFGFTKRKIVFPELVD